MHFLYVDESGSVGDPTQRFFVLAGFSVFEREPHWIDKDLNDIAGRFNARQPEAVELHGHPMRSGQGRWRHVPRPDRENALVDALIIGIRQRYPSVRVFASVLEKAKFPGQDIAQIAFEQISSRFDQYLGRLHRKGNTQRGLILFDKCATERHLQSLARELKTTGHTFGITRNFAEVPVFVDSEATRLIQLADLVAYAVFRHFEHEDSRLFDIISHCFDNEGGVQHGLYRR